MFTKSLAMPSRVWAGGCTGTLGVAIVLALSSAVP